MKNPNGYGSVVKLSGNRRKPYCARKTSGWNDKGYPIYKVIGYFAERQEAMIALAEYNRNPFDVDLSKITMKELFEKWSKRDFSKMSKSSASSHKSAFKHASALHNAPYKNIKAYQMQEVIDNCGCGYSTQGATFQRNPQTLDFIGFGGFSVTNLLLVQSNKFIVSFSSSSVLWV